jgi:glycosyltransferase involved in cell wall biosynthesis
VSPLRVVFGMNTMFAVRQFLPEILAMVKERGMYPVVIAPGGPPDVEDLAGQGVELRCVPVTREIAIMADLISLWRLWRVLRAVRPAVANMSTPKMALLGGMAAAAAGVPQRIYTLRGLRYETTKGWHRLLLATCERIACACAHHVVCISRSVREAAIRDGIVDARKAMLLGERASEGLPSRRTGLPGPAVTDALRRDLGMTQGVPVIGFVGRLTRDKGIGELARAFQMLQSQGRPAHLLLVGAFESGDPVDPEVVAWLRSNPDVYCTGFLEDPRPFLEMMDIFAFPTYREGLPMVLLEAAAAGKPVVSTRTTGVVDVVVDGDTGLLVPPGDPVALTRAIERLLDDRTLARQMGARARQLVGEQFENSSYLNRLGEMLQKLGSGQPDSKVRMRTAD